MPEPAPAAAAGPSPRGPGPAGRARPGAAMPAHRATMLPQRFPAGNS